MPKIDEVPDTLRPYRFHGINLRWKRGDKEALADCPFCDREGKFSVNIETGMWRCFYCAEGTSRGGGNADVFISKLWEFSDKATNDYTELAEARGLLFPETLAAWEVVKSITTDDWLVPGYTAEGNVRQLYRYTQVNGKYRLLPTPTLGHKLHGVNLFDPRKEIIYLCEGPWDGMALWEILGKVKATDGVLEPTANQSLCLLSQVNVLAVPGCQTFLNVWLPLFSGKDVVIMYDNDHPRTHPKTGQTIPPAGLEGAKRVARILSEAKPKDRPKRLSYLAWGGEGQDFDPSLPNGTDVRDYLLRKG